MFSNPDEVVTYLRRREDVRLLNQWATGAYDGLIVFHPGHPASVTTAFSAGAFGLLDDYLETPCYIAELPPGTLPGDEPIEGLAEGPLGGARVVAFAQYDFNPHAADANTSPDYDRLLYSPASIYTGERLYARIVLVNPAPQNAVDALCYAYEEAHVGGLIENTAGFAAHYDQIKEWREAFDREAFETALSAHREREGAISAGAQGSHLLAQALRLLAQPRPDEIDLLHAQTLLMAAEGVRNTQTSLLVKGLLDTDPPPEYFARRAMVNTPGLKEKAPPTWRRYLENEGA